MHTSFEITRELVNDHVHRYTVADRDGLISYRRVLRLWQLDETFLSSFDSVLADSPFSAFRWETPAITSATDDRPFEFVLINAPELARTPDRNTYAEYFTMGGADEGAVVFDNLGKDAVLVVPSPLDRETDYAHLAAFSRSAPDSQKQGFWAIVGHTAQLQMSDQPLWISTAGDGVAWLHVRLDSYPKYYRHPAYREDR